MAACRACGHETPTAIFKPVKMREDGTIELDGPLCRECARTSALGLNGTCFVKGGGSAAGRRTPAQTGQTKTVGGYYTGGERTGVNFI